MWLGEPHARMINEARKTSDRDVFPDSMIDFQVTKKQTASPYASYRFSPREIHHRSHRPSTRTHREPSCTSLLSSKPPGQAALAISGDIFRTQLAFSNTVRLRRCEEISALPAPGGNTKLVIVVAITGLGKRRRPGQCDSWNCDRSLRLVKGVPHWDWFSRLHVSRKGSSPAAGGGVSW